MEQSTCNDSADAGVADFGAGNHWLPVSNCHAGERDDTWSRIGVLDVDYRRVAGRRFVVGKSMHRTEENALNEAGHCKRFAVMRRLSSETAPSDQPRRFLGRRG